MALYYRTTRRAAAPDAAEFRGIMHYEIIGDPFPAVICQLASGEAMRTERGSMIWMSPNMNMETRGGGLGKMVGRMFSGEALFQNIYTANGNGMIAFGSSFPGKIIPLQITPGNDFIVQKAGFLAGEMGVELSVHFNQRIGGAFFGGEGFIMQRLSGQGTAFVECDGALVEYDLAPGQQIVVDTGNVLGYSASVQMTINRVKGGMNMVFGGEGLFNTVLTGPGKVWLQTMPFSSFVNTIAGALPTSNS